MSKLFQNKNKPIHFGLFLKISLLVFFTVAAVSFTACGGKEDIVYPNPNPDPDPEVPKDSEVVILNESDVQDFNKFYKPQDFKSMDFLRSDSKWSFVRSKQSEHFIVFWEAGFGLNPNDANVPEALRVNVDDLLQKAEAFYSINVNELKFAEVGVGKSNLDKYKMQIYLLYQTEWLATGAGYDNVIGALWVNPSTCKPVGSTIAHEIGHSFQYQVYCDLLANGQIPDGLSRGFRYGFGGNGGNGFWEQTAQWQSYQSYPLEAFQSYNFNVYMDNHFRHIGHEWQRYASYFIHYYWSAKYGQDFIGRLWRESVKPEDPMETFMRIKEISIDEFNAEMYDSATRFVTWDIDGIRNNGVNYIGKHTCKLYPLSDGTYQIAYSHCPGSTGYNAIPLNVPDAGTVVSTDFVALMPGSPLAAADPGLCRDGETTVKVTKYNSSSTTRAGWRYGYVALLKDGQRIYGAMNRKTSEVVNFTIPANCERLWFVVLGAPTSYLAHAWDEKESNDDQWPYTVKFTNTDLLGSIVIDPNQTPKDVTFTYNLSFAADATSYSGALVSLSTNGDLAQVANAFVMQPSEISSNMLQPKQPPTEGKIAFAAVQPDQSLSYNTTANGHGFWFDSVGSVIGWGSDNDSKVFAEFNPDTFEFNIGQYPGKSKTGDKYTIREALVYTKNGIQYKATFIFNIAIQ